MNLQYSPGIVSYSFRYAQFVPEEAQALSEEAQKIINFLEVTSITSSRQDRLQRIKFAVDLCSFLSKEESRMIHQLYIVTEWAGISGKN